MLQALPHAVSGGGLYMAEKQRFLTASHPAIHCHHPELLICCRLFITGIHCLPRWRSSSVHDCQVSKCCERSYQACQEHTSYTTVDKRSMLYCYHGRPVSGFNARSRIASRSIRHTQSMWMSVPVHFRAQVVDHVVQGCRLSSVRGGLQPRRVKFRVL